MSEECVRHVEDWTCPGLFLPLVKRELQNVSVKTFNNKKYSIDIIGIRSTVKWLPSLHIGLNCSV